MNRDDAYRIYVATMEARAPGQPVRTRDEFDRGFDQSKAHTLRALRGRRCPMTLEGVARIAGWLTFTDKISPRLSAVLAELVDEGAVVETHQPDGNDTYHAAEGPPGFTLTPEETEALEEAFRLVPDASLRGGLRPLARRLLNRHNRPTNGN